MKKTTTKTRKAKPRTAKKRQSILSQDKFNEGVVTYLAAEEKLLAKHGLAKRLVISFPHTQKVPLIGKIAQVLLTWSGAVLDTQFGVTPKK